MKAVQDLNRVSPADGELSEEDEEVDSNNEGGSLQSERTDKDEEAYDSESPARKPRKSARWH